MRYLQKAMKRFLHKLLFVLFVLLWGTSCKQRGCTDTSAENFEPKAKVDCGCCFYSSKGIVWASSNVQNKMRNAGVIGIRLYADGELVGGTEFTSYSQHNLSSIPPSDFDYESPNNEKNKGDVLDIKFGSLKEKRMLVNITDQNNRTLWLDSVFFKAATITAIEINHVPF